MGGVVPRVTQGVSRQKAPVYANGRSWVSINLARA